MDKANYTNVGACKPQKTSNVCTHWSTTIRMAAHKGTFLYCKQRKAMWGLGMGLGGIQRCADDIQ